LRDLRAEGLVVAWVVSRYFVPDLAFGAVVDGLNEVDEAGLLRFLACGLVAPAASATSAASAVGVA